MKSARESSAAFYTTTHRASVHAASKLPPLVVVGQSEFADASTRVVLDLDAHREVSASASTSSVRLRGSIVFANRDPRVELVEYRESQEVSRRQQSEQTLRTHARLSSDALQPQTTRDRGAGQWRKKSDVNLPQLEQ